MRILMGMMTFWLYLSATAFAQPAAAPQREAAPPPSQTAPWLQTLPGRRGLEPKGNPSELGMPIDINSAAARELVRLKGIGRARADGIIKGRPYSRTDELVTRNIISSDVFDGIKDSIVIRRK